MLFTAGWSAQTQFALQTIWLAFPIAEPGACIVSMILLRRAQKEVRQAKRLAIQA